MMLWTAIGMMSGCGVSLPEPVLLSVEPNRGWNGEQTVVSVEGANFYPQVQVNANRRSDVDLDRGFAAWLRSSGGVDFALTGVSALDYEHLSAVVEPGLPPGIYDLVVEGPTQGNAVLEDAFTVSDTRADRLGIDTESIVYTVNEMAFVDIQLLDPSGNPVLADLEVQVRIRGETQSVVANFGNALGNQIVAPDGLAITGFLGADGAARVPLTVSTPDTITLEVSPVEPTSPVRSEAVTLLFEVGGELSTVIELPNTPLSVAAGESFDVTVMLVDQFGNVAQDAEETLLIQTSCADFSTAADVVGSETVTITPTRSTEFGPDCAEQRLTVLSGPPGSSEPFEVRAGTAVSFDVQVSASEVIAGGMVNALISPRDAFENRTPFTDPVTVTDSVGGLGSVTCIPIQVDRFCSAPSFVAATGVQLLVTSGAVIGQSAPYDVVAAAELDAVDAEVMGPVSAGTPFTVAIAALDSFGNTIPSGSLGGLDVRVTDDLDEIVCEDGPPLADGRLAQSCVLSTVRPAAALTVEVDTLVVMPPGFPVVNGPIAEVSFSVPTSVEAGQSFSTTLAAFDAFGNPYLNQTVDTLDLVVEGVTQPVDLDATGGGSATVTLTRAGSGRLEAVVFAQSLGTSPAIEVRAGPAVELRVDIGEPWVFLGDPTTVQVEAVDSFGNRASDSLTTTVASVSMPGTEVVVPLTDGVGSAPFVWAGGVLDEQLLATGAGLAGATPVFDVVRSCANGPTAAVDFAGQNIGRACLNLGMGSVSMGFGGSVAGMAVVNRYAASVEGAPMLVQPTPSLTLPIQQVGESVVRGLVVDDALCGSETVASVWAGPDDGDPVGPVEVVVADASLAVGQESTLIELFQARDCTGDPAASGEIGVRADRGTITGAMATGTGLLLTVDATGAAQLTLDALDHVEGGPGILRLQTKSGGMSLEVPIDFVGDDGPPRVYNQDPQGNTSGLVSSAVLAFSEPMLESSMVPSAFSLSGPNVMGVQDVIRLGPERWEVLFDSPVDAGLGVWALHASDDLRDLGGNRLDGASDGGPSSWTQTFGVLPDGSTPVSCGTDTPVFRPDGDPGPGVDADTVTVHFDTGSPPAFWIVRVEDGTRILRQERLPIAGPSEQWSWDGRDAGERVVDPGTYVLVVQADDGTGNRSVGCSVPVTVEESL